MNHIESLRTMNRELIARHEEVTERIEHFRQHLLSPKFVGVDSDGDRKDWISTSDVLRFLEDLKRV